MQTSIFKPGKITNAVRAPAVAGMFYSEDERSLRTDLNRMIDSIAPPALSGTVLGLIVPHAGYIYSGSTAAYAYATIRKYTFDTVVLVSPSHREYFNGISVFNGSAYSTPLGIVAVDEVLRDNLVSGDTIIHPSSQGHGLEHAIEVQLPFLQLLFPELKILPIVMGDQRRHYCYHLADRLAGTLADTRSLVIASTDLSHYHKYDEAKRLDEIIINDIGGLNHDKLMDDLESERGEACGGGPAVAVLAASQLLGANRVNILHHCNSGDVTGDRDRVVGYLSAAVIRTN